MAAPTSSATAQEHPCRRRAVHTGWKADVHTQAVLFRGLCGPVSLRPIGTSRPVAITMALGLCIGLASAGSLYLWPRPDGVPATVWAGITPLEGLTWNWCEGTQSGAINWRADRELGLSLWLVPDRACHNARGGAGRVMSWHGDGRLRFPFHPSEPRRGGGNACPFEIAPAERASMTAALDEAIARRRTAIGFGFSPKRGQASPNLGRCVQNMAAVAAYPLTTDGARGAPVIAMVRQADPANVAYGRDLPAPLPERYRCAPASKQTQRSHERGDAANWALDASIGRKENGRGTPVGRLL